MWNPWDELDRIQQDMDRLFGRGEARMSSGGDFPAVNIWRTDHRAVVTAQLPGIDASALEVTVKNDTVTISGERPTQELEKGQEYVRQERGIGRFTRSFTLPFPVDPNSVTASYQRGILQVELPRAEQDKPRKITVGSD
jgi:HSP20 family protein